MKFLGYFGLLDHPTFTKAIRHLPVHEITSTPHLLLLPPSEHASLGWRSDPCVRLSVCCVAERATGVQLNRFSMFMSLPDSGFAKERDNASALRPDLPPAQIHASWYVSCRPSVGVVRSGTIPCVLASLMYAEPALSLFALCHVCVGQV